MSLDKICNLYASEFHFCTALMSFIDKNVETDKEVINIFEKDLEKSIKTLIEKTEIDEGLKENLLKINWNRKDIDINLEKEMQSFANEKEKIIFINGNVNYINTMDEIIEKWINKNKLDKNRIKIVHCYNIDEVKNNLSSIMELYPKILNVSGEHSIKKFYSYN